MKYKYEHDVVSELGHLGDKYHSNAHYDMAGEVEEVYAKAKSFNEIVPFVREQYVRANQNYGFAKYYGKSNEELKQAEEELLKIQEVSMTVCKVLGITLEEFIILEDKKMNNLIKQVYTKAKAWDNYLADVENSVREVTGNEDEVKWHVDYVINEYMEEKQND